MHHQGRDWREPLVNLVFFLYLVACDALGLGIIILAITSAEWSVHSAGFETLQFLDHIPLKYAFDAAHLIAIGAFVYKSGRHMVIWARDR